MGFASHASVGSPTAASSELIGPSPDISHFQIVATTTEGSSHGMRIRSGIQRLPGNVRVNSSASASPITSCSTTTTTVMTTVFTSAIPRSGDCSTAARLSKPTKSERPLMNEPAFTSCVAR